jgi:2-dehydropantoate 2-reductase
VKLAVVGAGAIGGYIGARLTQAGADVTLIARGPHLAAMRAGGLRLTAEGTADEVVRPVVTDDVQTVGPCDVVVLGVKAHALPALAPTLAPLLGPDTVVVSTQNGIPWWYFQRHGGEMEGWTLERVDPGGTIAAAIDVRRVVGSIAYFATEIVAPGVIRHIEGNRISLGEPDGSRSNRCREIADALIAAGLRCPVTTRIRHDVWVKLLGNLAFNPVSALTGATLADMARHPEVGRLARELMTEAEAVAARLGVELSVTIDQRMAGAEKVGAHKTSMLQDLEAGRPMEYEALIGAVVELGDRLGVPVQSMRAVYACVKLLDETRGPARRAS